MQCSTGSSKYRRLALLLAVAAGQAGCGGAPPTAADRDDRDDRPPATAHPVERVAAPPSRPAARRDERPPATVAPPSRDPRPPSDAAADTRLAAVDEPAPADALRPIDEGVVARHGIRRIGGRLYLILYTDLPRQPEIEALPGLFDQAVPQWAAYFERPAAEVADWQVRASLIGDKRPFLESGLLPAELPPFRNGYSVGRELWLYEQPSPYYRRHLFLHEGTHAFMNRFLGAGGPPWYAEGMAELLGTHALADGRLRLGQFPAATELVPRLGRIEMVNKALAAERGLTLRQVLAFSSRAHLENEPYGWCWALAALLDTHPRYRERFRGLPGEAIDADFNARFARAVATDWDALRTEWLVFSGTLVYGHDVARTALDLTVGEPLPPGGATRDVATDRGWQNTGLRLEAGRRYLLRAEGRYEVAREPKTWWCEPGGVTIRYVRGRPLGMLLAAVVPEGDPATAAAALLAPHAVGREMELTAVRGGTLHLAVNDSPGELSDNRGTVRVEVRRAP